MINTEQFKLDVRLKESISGMKLIARKRQKQISEAEIKSVGLNSETASAAVLRKVWYGIVLVNLFYCLRVTAVSCTPRLTV